MKHFALIMCSILIYSMGYAQNNTGNQYSLGILIGKNMLRQIDGDGTYASTSIPGLEISFLNTTKYRFIVGIMGSVDRFTPAKNASDSMNIKWGWAFKNVTTNFAVERVFLSSGRWSIYGQLGLGLRYYATQYSESRFILYTDSIGSYNYCRFPDPVKKLIPLANAGLRAAFYVNSSINITSSIVSSMDFARLPETRGMNVSELQNIVFTYKTNVKPFRLMANVGVQYSF